MADGSITIDTSFDTSGIQDADKVISKSLKRIGESFKKAFGMDFADKAEKNIQKMQEKYESASAAVEKQKEVVMQLKQELSDLESQRMGGENYREPEAAKPLIKQAQELEKTLVQAKKKYNEYTEQFNKGSSSAATKQEEWRQKVDSLSAEYGKVLNKIEQIENKSDAGIQTKITTLSGKVKTAEERFESLNKKLTTTRKKLKEAMNSKNVSPVTTAITRASKAAGNFGKRIGSLMKSALIFTVLTKTLTKIRELFSSMLSSNEEFSNSWARVKGNLLTAFQPIYERALPALMSLMHMLEQVTASLASMSAKLFGKSTGQMQANAKALYEQANATDAASKAAEEAQKSLAGFDEINQLSDNKSGSSSSGSGSSVMPDFSSEIGDTSKLDKILTYGTLLAGIGFLLVGIYTVNISAIVTGVALTALGLELGAGSGVFEDTPGWVRQVITWGGMIVGVIMLIVGICTLDIPLLIAGLAIFGVAAAYGVKSGAFDGFVKSVTDLFTTIKTEVTDWWRSVTEWFNTTIRPVFTKEYWREKFDKINQSILDFKTKTANRFSEIWSGIQKTFSNVGPWFRQKFTNAYKSVENAFSNAGSFFGNIWTTIKNKFTDIGVKIGDAIGGAFKKSINTVLETVEKVINKPIDAINSLLDVINKVPGIDIGHLDTVSLPRLATGTVVPANFGEFAAILGDNRRETEVVSPLSTMKQAFMEALEESGKNNGQPMIIQMLVDKNIIGEIACEYHNGIVVRTGLSPLKGI